MKIYVVECAFRDHLIMLGFSTNKNIAEQKLKELEKKINYDCLPLWIVEYEEGKKLWCEFENY